MDDNPSVVRDIRTVSWLSAAFPAVSTVLLAGFAAYESFTDYIFPTKVPSVALWGFALVSAVPIVWFAAVILGWRVAGMRRTFGIQFAVLVFGCAAFYALVAWIVMSFSPLFNPP